MVIDIKEQIESIKESIPQSLEDVMAMLNEGEDTGTIKSFVKGKSDQK